MRYILLLVSLLFLTIQSQAQVTISGRFLTNNSEAFDINYETENALAQGYEVGLGYWFRLKNKRMEFTPEISYTGYLGKDDVSGSSINFNSNILIYALDFHSDCNACPTFSKDGGLIKKGFHWILNPSVTKVESSGIVNRMTPSPTTFEYGYTTWRLGVGAGLDIGITNLLTIAPFAMIHIGGKDNLYAAEMVDSRYQQVHIGLRSTLRFDKDRW